MSKLASDVGPFAIIPLHLIEADISDRALRLFALLAGRYADREGRSFPSRKTLALALGCSADTIDRAIVELTSAGALSVVARRGPKGDLTSNAYTIHFAIGEGSRTGAHTPSRTDAATLAAPVPIPSRTDAATPIDDAQANVLTPEDFDATPPIRTRPTEPDPLNQIKESAPPADSLDPFLTRFDQFWSIWPKTHRTGKGAALAVWRKLKPSHGLTNIIVAAVERHKAEHPKWQPDWRGEVYIPNPRTWLNQRRWEDEFGTVAAPRRGPAPKSLPPVYDEPCTQTRLRPQEQAIDDADLDAAFDALDPDDRRLVLTVAEVTTAPYKARVTAAAYAEMQLRARRQEMRARLLTQRAKHSVVETQAHTTDNDLPF